MELGAIIDRFTQLEQAQDFAMAKAFIIEQIGPQPSDPKMCYRLGICCLKLGESEQAKQLFERARDIGPLMFQSFFWMGHYYADTHQPRPALTEIYDCFPYIKNETEGYLLYSLFETIRAMLEPQPVLRNGQSGTSADCEQLISEIILKFTQSGSILSPSHCVDQLKIHPSIGEQTHWLENKILPFLQRFDPISDHIFSHYTATLSTKMLLESPVQDQLCWHQAFFRYFMTTGRHCAEAAPHTASYFQKILQHSAVSLKDICELYHILYGYYWVNASSLSSMQGFYRQVVVPFQGYLAQHFPVKSVTNQNKKLKKSRGNKLVFIAHYASQVAGNALVPHIVSFLKEHAKSGHKAVVYCVQFYDQAFVDTVTSMGHETRLFPFDQQDEKLASLSESLRNDAPDIVLTEITSAMITYLFHQRIAPVQMWIEMGFPYWNSENLDWVFMAHKSWREDFSFSKQVASPLRLRQSYDTLNKKVPACAVQQVRDTFPKDAVIIGCFTRFSKLTPAFLSIMETVLQTHSQAYLLIAGSGDGYGLKRYFENSSMLPKVTLYTENVDVQIVGRAIDIFADSFPFPGGNSCREMMSFGKPVVAMESADWPQLIEESRDPELVANTDEGYTQLLGKLISDKDFYQARSSFAYSFTHEETAANYTYQSIMDQAYTLCRQGYESE